MFKKIKIWFNKRKADKVRKINLGLREAKLTQHKCDLNKELSSYCSDSNKQDLCCSTIHSCH